MRTLRAFIDFVTCHNDILVRQKKLKLLEHSLVDLIHQITLLHDSIALKRKEVIEQRKAIDAQELELKVLDAQEADKKKRLENAHTIKEFQSLTSELEIIYAKKNTLESLLFEALTTIEMLKKQEDTYTKTTQQTIATFQEQQKSLEQTQRLDAAALESQQHTCAAKRALVNKDLLERFDSMLAQVENPAVPIYNDSCSACFYSVPQTELGPAKKGHLAQCKDCYRLLYLE